MSKWQKLPIVVDAFKWTGDSSQEEDPWWAVEAIADGRIKFRDSGKPTVVLLIETLEGTMVCNKGDYVIRGLKGELYPCKPDIFEASYVKVAEA